MKNNVIISAKNLVKSFYNGEIKQTIINKLDLDIYENDFTIIMGSSGAGKSTLMYLLSGMDKADSGSITFKDKDICKMNNDELAIFRRKNVKPFLNCHHKIFLKCHLYMIYLL